MADEQPCQCAARTWPLIEPGADDEWLERLRPLANPELDLDDDSPQWWQMWARRGDLEAMAIRLCASHQLPNGHPAWLAETVCDAAFDRRAQIREAAWYAAARHKEWFEPHGARHALLDPESAVQVAALNAWRQQATEPLPTRVVLGLIKTGDVRVRLALIWLLKDQSSERAASELRRDRDAYVRGVAQQELKPET